MSTPTSSSRATKTILTSAIISFVVDMILIAVHLFVLPRWTLLAPLCTTATNVFLLSVVLLKLNG